MEKELRYDVRKVSPIEQEELRKKIVREMHKRGNTSEVAEFCECSLSHVQSTWKKYCDGGVASILAVSMGRPKGKCCKLTPEQEAAIREIITDKNPSEVGLVGYLWSRAEVCELVKREFGIEIPVRTMGDYLARWNFTYQRPQKKITAKTRKP
jgi:transposase